MRWFRERIRGIIRRRSTKWWKRRGRKTNSCWKITRSFRLLLAFHVRGAASCVGLSRQSVPQQQSQFYLYPGFNANEHIATPPSVSVYPSPCTNRSSLPDTSHAVCFIRVVGLMLLLTCPACLNATWWCALIQVLNAHAWSLPSIPSPSLSSLLNLDTLVLNSMGGGNKGLRNRLSVRELHARLPLERKKA